MLFNSLIESISASWHLFFQDPKLYFIDNISNYIEIKFSHEAANVSPNNSHNYNDFKAQVKKIRAIGYNG